jgi:hypothetical protein
MGGEQRKRLLLLLLLLLLLMPMLLRPLFVQHMRGYQRQAAAVALLFS